MVFSSAVFLFLFLPLFLLGTLLTSRLGTTARNLNIVIFSFAFYLFGSGLYSLILLGSILFNWWFARYVIVRHKNTWLLALGVTVNLVPLLLFKYLDFLFELSTQYFFRPFLALDLPVFKLFLPAGISFYTFQAISYLIDVKRGETLPEHKLLTFAAYELLFPQLVAGPIVRYTEIRAALQQVYANITSINAGIFFFGMGLAKKMLIADPLGRLVDGIHALPAEQVTNLMAWLASVGYMLQIFFDFSGYSEMAIGLGLMIGFSFPDNFNQPYRSASITEFWRRWHMTLSRWFRDYLYIPLGGNRHGQIRTLVNLWIVFLLCGLWHGAALTFVAWGAYHGALLVIERLGKRYLGLEPRGLVGVVLTLLLVLIGWVVFRADTFEAAATILAKLFFLDQSGSSLFGWQYYLTPYWITIFVVGGVLATLPLDRWELRRRVEGEWSFAAAWGGLVLILLSVAALAANGFNPFIYFRF